MVRGLTIGSTNYSSQSLQDMLVDLENWILSLKDSDELFESTIKELEKSGYWSSVDYDFKASCYDLRRYFNTAVNDLQEVINGINSEIKEYHIKLLKNLGINAREQHTHHRKVWKEYQNQEYGDTNFRKVEKLYAEGSDMAGDMLDLNNLALRLEHFVGMSKQDSNSKSGINVNNHFHSTVTGIQQNYDSHDIQQTLNLESNKSKEIEEMKIIINQFKGFLEQSTSDEKEEIAENLSDLEGTIEKEEPKKNRIKSFGNAVSTGMKNMLTMKSFNNADEVATKLPKIIDNFNNILDKF
ncbi:hypothetical protein [Priestia megaterium]|uniref:hypothetical protein n=1 Tax=Priestia megaterium TaxID=1404 RepID=UPI00177DC272|nr:hypothetical protein [Priestia megaterium]MBD8848407.1 hypothetical protein [Priestia megaterium]